MKLILSLIFLYLSACSLEKDSNERVVPNEDEPTRPTSPTSPTPETPVPDAPEDSSGFALRNGLTISQSAYLEKTGEGIALRIQDFRNKVRSFGDSINSYCSDISSSNLLEPQNKFAEVMKSWEHIELYQVGPLAAQSQQLKYNVYVWPQIANYCNIDDESLKAMKVAEYNLPSASNRKGLLAFEYLLFESELKTSCTLTSRTGKEWEALSKDQKWEARCSYMEELIPALISDADSVYEAWGTPENNYIKRILGNQTNENILLQELYEQLFYMDIEVKNLKLAMPAGLDPLRCHLSPEPCLDKQELKYSNLARTSIDANFQAFVDLMYGFQNGESEVRAGGFSALIRAQGHSEIADRSESVIQGWANNQASNSQDLNLMVEELDQQSCDESKNSWICSLTKSIKDISSLIKNDYSKILGLKVPNDTAGDND